MSLEQELLLYGIQNFCFNTRFNCTEERKRIIFEYYKPIFEKNLSKNYDVEITSEIDLILKNLIDYYYENGLNTKIDDFLRRKAKVVLNDKRMNFDDAIFENEDKIRLHYTLFLFKKMKKVNKNNVLADDEVLKLSVDIINQLLNSYVKSDKSSLVNNYFNSLIRRKILCYENEEKLIYDYCIRFGPTKDIVNYFYEKCVSYEELAGYDLTKKEYLILIEEILNNINSLHFVFKTKLIEKVRKINKECKDDRLDIIEEIRYGNFDNVELLRCLYSNIIDLVFDKFKDKVYVSNEEFKKILKQKYDEYFDKTVVKLYNDGNINFQRYLNVRLSNFCKTNKRLNSNFFVDEEEKDQTIRNNESLIDVVFKRYKKKIIPSDVLEDIIIESYYKSAEEYFKIKRKRDFASYVDYKMNSYVKKMNLNK